MKIINTVCRWTAGVGLCALTFFVNAECNTTLKNTFDDSAVTLVDGGLLVDSRTGLMWMRCALGYEWQNNSCARIDGQMHEFTWPDALQAATQQNNNDYSDWRLPNKNELSSIIEHACFDPAINLTLFPQTEVKGYWTNSPNNFNDFSAWAINFTNGDHISTARTNLLGVRLVREVQ